MVITCVWGIFGTRGLCGLGNDGRYFVFRTKHDAEKALPSIAKIFSPEPLHIERLSVSRGSEGVPLSKKIRIFLKTGIWGV